MIQKTIRRFGSLPMVALAPMVARATMLALFAMLFIAATSTKSAARNHTTRRHGKHGRIAQNAGHHHQGHRFARLSRHGMIAHPHSIPQRALTTQEKTEIVQKIRQLAESPSQVTGSSDANVSSGNSSSGDDSIVAAEASSPDIQSQIAEAAKEEQAEDNVEVSLDKYFKARPSAAGAADQSDEMASALDPAMDAERLPDVTLFDETDPSRAAQRSDVMAEIIDWIGTRYVFGGENRAGIDCSAFTRAVFSKSFGIELPRTAFDQSQLGDPVNKSDLQFGDLVFFKTAGYAPITHVGIYIGEGLFANAACSRGVTVASLESEYWSKHYVEARRLFSNSGMAAVNASPVGSALADGGN